MIIDRDELKKYSINLYDLLVALIWHGQHDMQFKLGDTIKYDPCAVAEIALKWAKEEVAGK